MLDILDQVLRHGFFLEGDEAEATRLPRIDVFQDYGAFDCAIVQEMLPQLIVVQLEVKAADKDL